MDTPIPAGCRARPSPWASGTRSDGSGNVQHHRLAIHQAVVASLGDLRLAHQWRQARHDPSGTVGVLQSRA